MRHLHHLSLLVPLFAITFSATAAEHRVKGHDYSGWPGIVGTPATLNRSSTGLSRATQSPDIVKRLEAEAGILVEH